MSNHESSPSRLSQQHVEVFYGGDKLVPAPLIDWSVGINRDETESREKVTTTLTLEGTVVALASSDEGFKSIQEARDSLLNIFSTDNKEFKIQAGAGNPFVASGTVFFDNVFPRVASIDFPSDVQYNRIDYVISLEYDETPNIANSGVEGVTNSWSFNEDSSLDALRITHNISANGVRTNDNDALTNVRLFILDNIGISNIPSGFPVFVRPSGGLSVGQEVSYQRSETIDEDSAQYSVVEEFLVSPSGFLYLESQNATYSEDEAGIVTVAVQGTVQGLGRNVTTDIVGNPPFAFTGYDNAISGFNNVVRPRIPTDASGVYSRFQGAGTLAINNPQSISITENRREGSITYNFSYTDDPGENLPSGIASRTCSVQYTEALQEFVFHPVFSRQIGPLLQDICTTQTGSVQVQCSVTAKSSNDSIADTNRAIAFAQDEINRLRPNASDYIEMRISQQSQTNNENELSCTASVTYTVTSAIDSVPSVNSDIVLRSV